MIKEKNYYIVEDLMKLVKDKYNEYQKTVDICVEINNILINVEINREYFKMWRSEILYLLINYIR